VMKLFSEFILNLLGFSHVGFNFVSL
jgi:hypothetical protein